MWPLPVGALVLAGAVFFFHEAAGSLHESIEIAAGTACLLIAGVLWRGIAAQVVILDRSAGSVQVRTQHILGTSTVVHRFSDVADVVLERRPMSDGRDFFRPAFVMRNGTHEAWGSYAFNNVRPDQVAVVRAMREFLGTASSSTAPDGSVAFPRPSTDPLGWAALPLQQRCTALVMLVFTFVVSSLLFGGGVWLAWNQHQRLTTYRPVAATVLSTDVVVNHDNQGQVTQRPSIRYTYRVNGLSYSSDAVTPFNEARSADWAHQMTAPYHRGETITVYYDPINPGHAYIVKTWSILPWVLIAGSSLFLCISVILARGALASRRHPATWPPIMAQLNLDPNT